MAANLKPLSWLTIVSKMADYRSWTNFLLAALASLAFRRCFLAFLAALGQQNICMTKKTML